MLRISKFELIAEMELLRMLENMPVSLKTLFTGGGVQSPRYWQFRHCTPFFFFFFFAKRQKQTLVSMGEEHEKANRRRPNIHHPRKAPSYIQSQERLQSHRMHIWREVRNLAGTFSTSVLSTMTTRPAPHWL